MYRHLLLSMCLIYFFISSSAQIYESGANLQGLAGAGTTIRNAEALWTNVANLLAVPSSEVVIISGIHHGLTSLPSLGAGGVFPYKESRIGLNFSRTGNQYLNRNLAGISIAHKIDKFSLGLNTTFHHFSAGEYGSANSILFRFGGSAEITSNLIFGAYVQNVTFSKISINSPERHPVIAASGFSYKITENVIGIGEIAKEVGEPGIFKLALQYTILPSLLVRSGLSSNPYKFHFGAGIKIKNFQIHYSVVTHPALSMSHFLTLSSCIAK